MPVNRYLDIDLSPDSPAIRDLHARAEAEAARPAIGLTGDGDAGSLGPNMTPEMRGWLSKHIDRTRQGAIAAAQAAAARIKLPGEVNGIVEQIEEDRLKRRRNERKAEETGKFYDRFRAKLDKLTIIEREYNVIRTQEGGRDARVPPKIAEYGIPAIIAVPEFFMNYASFTKLAGVPAVGFGLSAAVAIAVAVSSYMAGSFWKAYQFYMQPDDEVQRQKGMRRIGIASLLLVVSLAAVGYARYHMVLEQVEAATVLGMAPPNIAAQTAGLLAGNLLVWAIGAAVTYLMHDENPLFAEKAIAYRKLRDEIERARHKELNTKLDGIERQFQQDCRHMTGKARLMYGQPDYGPVSEMISAIDAKDAEVTGALNDYRMRLADGLHARNPDFKFAGPTTDRHVAHGVGTYSLAEFTALPLDLYRSN